MNASADWTSIPVVFLGLGAVQLGLQIYALVLLFRTPDERLHFGMKWPWALIILLGSLLGSIVFLAVGRRPAAAIDPLAAGRTTSADAPQPADRATRAAETLYGPRSGEDS